jgi:hypothetical protein
MEVFGDVIPGVILLAGVWVLLSTSLGPTLDPVTPVTDSLGVVELGLLGVVSFVVGMVLQGFGQKTEHLLDRLARGTDNRLVSSVTRCLAVTRISMTCEIEALSKEPSTVFQEAFWRTCRDEFEFLDEPLGKEDADHLWRVVQASVAASPYSLASRYRALNNMCRGLWAGFGALFLLFLLYLGVIGFARVSSTPVGRSDVFLTYTVVAGVFTLAFGHLKNMFKRLWVNNLLFEYYLSRIEQPPTAVSDRG